MLNVIGNTASFFLNQIGKNNPVEIFQKAENINTESIYNYTEQKGIIGKPSIVFSGVELIRYSLPIKLHFSYCNPSKIIQDLKQIAQNREVISYFQDEEYKGDFVITKIVENPITHYKDKLLCAEITVDLLEVPQDPDMDYTQKTNPNKSVFENFIEDKASNVRNAAKTIINNPVAQKITDAALDMALGQAESYISGVVPLGQTSTVQPAPAPASLRRSVSAENSSFPAFTPASPSISGGIVK